MTPGLKITLTAEALGALLDAARTDEQANVLCRQLDALTPANDTHEPIPPNEPAGAAMERQVA